MKTIRDFNLEGKKVIIRVDYNVPIKDGKILDDKRIVSSLETVCYAINKNAKVILMSHLGRIKQAEDKKNNSLKIVSEKLGELLNKNVIFIDETRGEYLEEKIGLLNNGDVLLMQNTRYEDLNNEAESKNSIELGKYWASLADIYINDAFATSHRSHASNVGIASNLPCGIGFLIEKELNNLMPIIKNPIRPFTVILGGAKVKDKIGVIKNLVEKADYILIGGGMAYTFLKASGLSVGKSIIDEENIEFCKDILEKYPNKIILPIDSTNSTNINSLPRQCFISDIKENEIGFDIGYQTVKLFKTYLKMSKTIIWNGPLGMFEEEKYENGTKKILEELKNIDAIKIIGGGDTASAAKKFNMENNVTFISTGGGACLELLEGKKLPGIEVIDSYEKNNN